MDKYNEFKGLINELNKYLNKKYDLDENTTLGKALNKSRNKDSQVRFFEEELRRINKLRNTIVHESDKKGPLAIPTDEIISRLEYITRTIKSPKCIKCEYGGVVKSFDVETPLREVLLTIREKNYTQFPIFEKNNFIGMLTENSIANWLSSKVEEEIILIEDVCVKDIIKNEEGLNAYKILEHNKSIYDVYEVFSKRDENKGPIVILISKTIKLRKPEDILGIITHWDIKDIDK